MLRSGDVVWETEQESAEKPYTDTPGITRSKSGGNSSYTIKKKAQKSISASKSCIPFDSSETNGTIELMERGLMNGVTLKDLNPHDKQKIAHLIKELAKVGEEKENIASTLSDERQKFLTHVRQLEDEKHSLMSKQKFLSEEVKQCQMLLQYYQDLTTMQQTSLMTHEGQRKQHESVCETTSEDCHKSASFHEATEGPSSGNISSQSDHVTAKEVYSGDTEVVSSSFTDDEVLRMSDRRYKAYLRKKKDKLKKEQESLRKLLNMKVAHDSHLMPSDEIEISPVRDDWTKSQGTPASVTKRSVLVQTYPSANEQTLPCVSPLRSTSKISPCKSYVSSQSNGTLKRSTSSELILSLLAQDTAEDDIRNTLAYSVRKPATGQQYDLSSFSSDGGITSNVMNCEDSQILQDIFFV